MEPPDILRTRRVVRNYSTDGLIAAPPTRLQSRSVSSQDRWKSPHEWSIKSRSTEKLNGDLESPRLEDARLESPRLESPRRPDVHFFASAEKKTYEPSISTQNTATTGASVSRVTDFFSQDVFHIVLRNPTTAHRLMQFARSRLCGENLEFLDKLNQYQHSLNQVTKIVFDIHRNYLSVNAPSQVNLPDDVLVQINKNLKTLLARTMPSMETAFLSAQNDIERLVAMDMYPRFVRHQMTTSATRALATNKNKYAGLGDCFVLTDPNKADNPIVYATDGFVKVTGYDRKEIIPRNCRFLQQRHTDRESVARIKSSLTTPAENVELLLNARKDGEPFWNLLYTAPLYDANGRLAFFIGGQINVSTTVHNTSDILRILSYDGEHKEEETVVSPPPTPIKERSSFFNTLRKPKPSNTWSLGMENELLDDLNTMSLKDQKNAFYSAYSRYIIINAQTMLISFHSPGIIELLYPAKKPTRRAEAAGHDIFKFLGQHSQNSLSKDHKSQVKAAAKAGQAITLPLNMCTRRTMGFEQFLVHWTPLKDESNVTVFIVLTLGSLRDARNA